MKPIYAFLFVALLMGQVGLAQSTADDKPAADKKVTEKKDNSDNSGNSNGAETVGPTAFVQLSGNNFNMGSILTYDFNLGYQINSKVSIDVGIPLMTTRTFFPIVKGDYRYTTILGAPYADVKYQTRRGSTNITSILTGSAGFNMVKTYSNGRFVVDWFNHFDRNYQVLSYDAVFTPFVNLGVGDGSVDRQVMPRPYAMNRPYETLGGLANGEVGGAFTIKKFYRIEASAYGLSPFGPQKVYSRIVAPDDPIGGDGHRNRYWDQYFETGGALFNTFGSGPSRISRDNGYGANFELTRYKNLTVQVGYERSVHYAYDQGFIMIRYNFTHILRNLTVGE